MSPSPTRPATSCSLRVGSTSPTDARSTRWIEDPDLANLGASVTRGVEDVWLDAGHYGRPGPVSDGGNHDRLRLAGAGRSQHEHGVSAGRGQLEPSGHRLA